MVSREMMLGLEREVEQVRGRRGELGVSMEGEGGMDVEEGEGEGEREREKGDEGELQDISNQNSVRKRIYTARDRLFFSRFAEIHSKYREFEERMKNITDSEAGIHDLLKQCDR